MEFSDVLHDPQVIFPLHTWRGSYDGGVTQGQCAYYTTNGTQLAPAPDSTPTEGDTQYRVHANSGYGSTAEHCVTVDWPAAFMLSARQLRRGYAGPDSWMGSLIFESRDASGLYYRRNRYYDSEKQRFTQEDPIGIAGGINVYGFGSGDPITYADPYGLCCSILDLSDFAAGFGDAVTFGATNLIRQKLGWNDHVRHGSTAYGAGAVSGVVAVTVATEGAASSAEVTSAARGTEVVERAMSRAELSATEETGLVRGGREGTHYVSDAVNHDALRTRQRLALPQTPEVRVKLAVPEGTFSAPSKVESAFGMPGGGVERTATGPVPVKVLSVHPYE